MSDTEIIFLNEFGWSKETIAWKKLLPLLKKQAVPFPAPKNNYTQGICLSKDAPIVSTLICRILYERNRKTDDMENEMGKHLGAYLSPTIRFQHVRSV